MATITGATFKILADALLPETSPKSGSSRIYYESSKAPANGTAAAGWDLAGAATYTISASGTQSIDLTSFDGLAFAEVDALIIVANSANPDIVSVKTNATNGWASFMSDPSDIIKLNPGQKLITQYDAGLTVGASNKVLDLVNTDSGDTADVTVYVFGRSA